MAGMLNSAASASAIRYPYNTRQHRQRGSVPPLFGVCFLVSAHIPHHRRPTAEGERPHCSNTVAFLLFFFLFITKAQLGPDTKLHPKQLCHSFFIWKFNKKTKKSWKLRWETNTLYFSSVSQHMQSVRKHKPNRSFFCLFLTPEHFSDIYTERRRMRKMFNKAFWCVA